MSKSLPELADQLNLGSMKVKVSEVVDGWRTAQEVNLQSRILILGAGPGGLSAAYYLQKRGFSNITVFESLSHVGGMCRSVTEHQHPVELGASFVSPTFRHVIDAAKELGVKLSRFRGAAGFTFNEMNRSAEYRSLLTYAAGGSGWKDRFGLIQLFRRFLRERNRYSRILDRPGWAGVAAVPELCVSFTQWLRDRKLETLQRFFELPITTFGYGPLDEIPAAYALKYMTTRNLMGAVAAILPFSEYLPSALSGLYFPQGYQRFWEQLSWSMDVRLNVAVQSISRDKDRIEIIYTLPQERMEAMVAPVKHRTEFDFLFIACPMMHSKLDGVVEFDENERQLLSESRCLPHAMICVDVVNLKLRRPLAIPIPPSGFERPLVLWQPTPAAPTFVILVRLKNDTPTPGMEQQLREQIEQYITALGGRIIDENSWRSFNVWPHFKHASIEAFGKGLFDRWDTQQGRQCTFYLGGLFDFDHVEGTMEYSQYLVDRFFSQARSSSESQQKQMASAGV